MPQILLFVTVGNGVRTRHFNTKFPHSSRALLKKGNQLPRWLDIEKLDSERATWLTKEEKTAGVSSGR
jgi:hypothetical protein